MNKKKPGYYLKLIEKGKIMILLILSLILRILIKVPYTFLIEDFQIE